MKFIFFIFLMVLLQENKENIEFDKVVSTNLHFLYTFVLNLALICWNCHEKFI